MSQQQWLFQPADTWFFREARAHDAVGAGQLASQFPPSVTTLMGAVRTALGDAAGIDWARFANDSAYFSWLGDGDQLGELRLAGPQLYLGDVPLYPMPADVLAAPDAAKEKEEESKVKKPSFSRLGIGAPVRCDLGLVALPELNDAPPGSKPVEGAWLTAAGMARWQAGEPPLPEDLVWTQDHMDAEPRLGIGRDNKTGTVEKGLLYQTLHLRFRAGSELRIGLTLDGVPEEHAASLPAHTGLRLGGEGREAQVSIQPLQAPPAPKLPQAQEGDRGLVIMLDTPAAFLDDGQSQWCLPGFTPVSNAEGQVTHWQGSIAGVELKLVSTVMGRMERVGGWDQRRRKPRAVTSRVAPGSLFYCTPAGDATPAAIQAAMEALNGLQLGEHQAWGLGRLRVGRWRGQGFMRC